MAMLAMGITDPIPLWKDVGNAQPSAIKGTPPHLHVWAPGFIWGANTSKQTQLFQALNSFSSLNASRPPERHSGRLQSTAQVERDYFSILKCFSASGLHITIRFHFLAHYLFFLVQNHLTGSHPLSSRCKANTQDISKAMGNVLGFAKLFYTVLMKTHYGYNANKIHSTEP